MTTAGQVRNAFPAVRVFIFGQEVTSDVITVRVNLDDSRAPSTAEIDLVNHGTDDQGAGVEDRYIITELDIQALYDSVNIEDVQLPDMTPMLQGTSDAAAAIAAVSAQLAPFGVDPFASIDTNQLVSGAINKAAQDYLLATEKTQNDIDAQIRRRLQRAIQDPVKRRILDTKIQERVQVTQPDFKQTGTLKSDLTGKQLAALRGEAYRYSFQVGDCVFQSNDPVRVFMRDIFNPKIWYYAFTGFVSDWADDVDANNKKMVTLKIEDVTRVFRYARITTNPGIFDIDALEQNEDAVIRSFYNETGFTNLTLPEVLYTICFGSEVAGTDSLLNTPGSQSLKAPVVNYARVGVNGRTDDKTTSTGVGAFNFDRSITFIFGTPPTIQSSQEFVGPLAPGQTLPPSQILQKEVPLTGAKPLAVYQAIVDNQVSASDLDTMVLRGHDPISRDGLIKDGFTGAPKIDEVIKAIGEHPELYPVDGGRLILLLPASLGPETNRDLLLRDIIQSVALQTTFRNRLAMIYDIVQRVEFSFYANQKGDLLCEMPLFNFEPNDFGTEPVTRADVLSIFTAVLRPETSAESVGVAFDVGETRGPFAPHYHVVKRDTINWQRSFTDEKVRTQVACPWYVVQGYESIGTSDAIGQAPAVTTLRSLFPQFGPRFEMAEPTGFIASKEAAQIYGALKLSQLNADARSQSVNALPMLRVGPNRPLLFSERSYIATTRSVGLSLEWNSGFSMNLGTNYTRGWAGQLKVGTQEPLYEPLGGFAAGPLNYAVLFATTQPPASTATPSTQPLQLPSGSV